MSKYFNKWSEIPKGGKDFIHYFTNIYYVHQYYFTHWLYWWNIWLDNVPTHCYSNLYWNRSIIENRWDGQQEKVKYMKRL